MNSLSLIAAHSSRLPTLRLGTASGTEGDSDLAQEILGVVIDQQADGFHFPVFGQEESTEDDVPQDQVVAVIPVGFLDRPGE